MRKALILILICTFILIGSSRDKKPSDKARIELLETKLANLQQAFLEMHNEDINELYARTLDLHGRLKKVEENVRAQAFISIPAQLNGLDARVAELERPEVEDEAK